ncbi:GTP pyrophosphokinase family protein [Anaerofustis sp.]|uniref:GTP pyrophosphokinase n=1 Tax=Anaerofustis sp. TaxID=1872517 RepID=UPI0025B95E94|nr:GTP pyrophosphokinase family protein [Anaerofustis sp.]
MLENSVNWGDFLYPYKQAVDELVLKFKTIRNQKLKTGQYSEIEEVHGRVKKVKSILEKLEKNGYKIEDIERKITDLAGIRIICQFEEDITKVANHIMSRNDMKVVIKKDYLSHPKESGYRSVHLVIEYQVHTAFGVRNILCEIQIRTLAINFWATIEHSLNYKYEGDIPEEISNRLRIAASKVEELDKEMSAIRDEVMHAQKLFMASKNATIMTSQYISLLNKMGYLELGNKYVKIFNRLSEKDDTLQLMLLEKELEAKVKNLAKKENKGEQ